MMKRTITTFFCLLCLTIAGTAVDGNRAKRQLTQLFNEAEHCYLIDDYQQLDVCLTRYADTLRVYRNIIDSTEVFNGYFYKMCGAYNYGFAEDSLNALYSEQFYRRSLDVFNKQVRTRNIKGMHANAVVLHQELAQLYYKIGEYSMAQEQLDTVLTYFDGKLAEGIDSLKLSYYNTLSQLAMCNSRLGNFDLALAQIDLALNDYFKKHKDAYYFEALRKRGKILMLQADNLGCTQYNEAVDCYHKYVNERYAAIGNEMNTMNETKKSQYWLATHQFLYDCFRLGNHAPEMLYDLALFSKDYLVRKNATQTTWKQVKQVLNKQDCAIEFVQYFGKDDEKRIGCLVLRSDSRKPLFIDMFSTDSLLSQPLTRLYTIGRAITHPVSTVKDMLYNDSRLPQMIWSTPLLSAIGDAKNVYFAPDGLLHQLAIEYLMPDTTKVCFRLSSTRILTQKHNAPKLSSALLCGGIEYDAFIHPNDRNNDVVAYRFLSSQKVAVKALEWTKKEIEAISTIRSNPGDTLLIGRFATDMAFLQLLKRDYPLIHLSTHGYFGGRIGIYSDIRPLHNDDSMSKSGILFAGSANSLGDSSFDENLFDGVLSAAELSRQDLSKTELIVLSACQTGLGHLTDDGIYGIQRGLKEAGANAMILSLWSVDDYSSSLLMQYFYEELEKQPSKDIHSAFLKARLRLAQKDRIDYTFDESTFIYKKRVLKYNTPKYINPFIIIDAY